MSVERRKVSVEGSKKQKNSKSKSRTDEIRSDVEQRGALGRFETWGVAFGVRVNDSRITRRYRKRRKTRNENVKKSRRSSVESDEVSPPV